MNCNYEIHDEFENMGEFTCPFCDEQLKEYISVEKDESCCENMKVENNNGEYVCVNCGVVDSYEYFSEYLDFYENVYKLRRKSVYHRKYHIKNVLDDIRFKHRIQISTEEMRGINVMFKKIEGVLLNDRRKRSIKLHFIFRKLFELMKSHHYKYFKLPKSNKTLKQYNTIWKNICEKCGLTYIKSEKVDADPLQKDMSSIYSKNKRIMRETKLINYKYDKMMSNL